MQKWNGSLLRKFDDTIDGNASVGTTVVVRNTVGNTIAVIYDVDDTNSVQKNNPFVTDDFGRYSFFAPNGKYTIEFGDGSDSIEIVLVDNIDHSGLSGRFPLDGSAHTSEDIGRGNATVEDALVTIEDDISALQLGQGSGVLGYATLASLTADLTPVDKSIAYVTNDAIATNNGTYRKSGATGVGSWIQTSTDLASQAYQIATDNVDDIISIKDKIAVGDNYFHSGDSLPISSTGTNTSAGKYWATRVINQTDEAAGDGFITSVSFESIAATDVTLFTATLNEVSGFYELTDSQIVSATVGLNTFDVNIPLAQDQIAGFFSSVAAIKYRSVSGNWLYGSVSPTAIGNTDSYSGLLPNIRFYKKNSTKGELVITTNATADNTKTLFDEPEQQVINPEQVLASYNNDNWSNNDPLQSKDWYSPPPESAIRENTDVYIKNRYGVQYWVEFLSGVGYTNAGTANNVFMRYTGATSLANKWIATVLIVRVENSTDSYPLIEKGFLWDPAVEKTYTVSYQQIDELTRVYFCKFQAASSETSVSALFGSRFGLVSNNFKVGAWRSYILDSEPTEVPVYNGVISSIRSIKAVESLSVEKYSALGDSITQGVGSFDENTSWSDLLNNEVLFDSYENLAVSGATTMFVANPLRVRLLDEVNSISPSATLITVLIGVNDMIQNNPIGDPVATLSETFASLTDTVDFSRSFRLSMETIKRNHPNARVFAITPLQTKYSGYTHTLQEYRDAIEIICNWLCIPVIYGEKDLGIWGSDPSNTLLPDTLHPNDAGYDLIKRSIKIKLT